MSPELVQSLVESASSAAAAVGEAGVLSVLAGLAELSRGDTRAVTVEATQLRSGDVELAVMPRRVSVMKLAA